MFKNIFISLLILMTCPTFGQVITSSGGPTYIAHIEKVPIHPEARGKRLANDDYFLQVNYQHNILENWNMKVGYSQYPIFTYFRFFKENAGGSEGWNGTNVQRFDLGMNYVVFANKKIIIQPSFSLGIQRSIPRGVGIIGGDLAPSIKPDHFELLKNIEAYAYNNTQIVPVLGLKLGYAFWSRLELFIEIQQVFGFKTIQELRMSYSYKGIEQPEAISYSDGTSRFWAIGLGYRIVKRK